jgi:hypothetical protein
VLHGGVIQSSRIGEDRELIALKRHLGKHIDQPIGVTARPLHVLSGHVPALTGIL